MISNCSNLKQITLFFSFSRRGVLASNFILQRGPRGAGLYPTVKYGNKFTCHHLFSLTKRLRDERPYHTCCLCPTHNKQHRSLLDSWFQPETGSKEGREEGRTDGEADNVFLISLSCPQRKLQVISYKLHLKAFFASSSFFFLLLLTLYIIPYPIISFFIGVNTDSTWLRASRVSLLRPLNILAGISRFGGAD